MTLGGTDALRVTENKRTGEKSFVFVRTKMKNLRQPPINRYYPPTVSSGSGESYERVRRT